MTRLSLILLIFLLSPISPVSHPQISKSIIEIIDCILHNEKIENDVNRFIDAVIKGEFMGIIAVFMEVFYEMKTEIGNCWNGTIMESFGNKEDI